MVRNGCASIREGDLFHGRYRILRNVENDRTGAVYEAIDMVNDTRRILKVVQAETLAGTGIRVRFKSDAPLWDTGNVAYLSDAGLDHDTKSFFLIMELAEDSELEPVTKQRVIHLGGFGAVEKQAAPKSSDSHPELEPTVLRAVAPLPLPPPLPSSPSRNSYLALPPPPPPPTSVMSRKLPPPTPPPEKTPHVPTPLPGARMLSAGQFIAILGIAIGVASAVHLHLTRAANESSSQKTGPVIAKSPEPIVPISAAPMMPEAALADPKMPDASVPTNYMPSETASPKAEDTASKPASSVMTAPEVAPPKLVSSKAPAQKTNKSPTNDNTAAPTKKHRESIY